MNSGVASRIHPWRLLLPGVALLSFILWTSAHGLAGGVWSAEISLPAAVQEVSVTALSNQVYVVGGSRLH